MPELKSGALVAFAGAFLLAATGLFSEIQRASPAWLILALSTVLNFMVIFFVSLLPMPAAILFRKWLASVPKVISFVASLAFGFVMIFLLLKLIETPTFETDGVSTTYRHAGPTVNASSKAFYYLYAAPVLIASLLVSEWMRRGTSSANKLMQLTCEDARG
jgi:uncharacterized membrane protein